MYEMMLNLQGQATEKASPSVFTELWLITLCVIMLL